MNDEEEARRSLWCMVVTNFTSPKQVALVTGMQGAYESSNHPDTGKRFTLRQLGDALGKNHGVISRWLSGERIPESEDVASFCTALGVHGQERDRLIELARATNDPDLLTKGVPGADETMQGALESEDAAEEIIEWSLALVPGLLQVSDYARRIVPNDNLVRLRLGRRVVIERINPARFVAYIGEAALLNPIGGDDVMVAQLRHLLRVREQSNVDVRVVPIRAGAHRGLIGPFTHYRFPAVSKIPNMVYVEHYRTGVFLSAEQHVTDYESVIDELGAVALSPEESAAMFADLVSGMESSG